MQIKDVEYLDIYSPDELQGAANELRDMLMAQHDVPDRFAVAAGGYANSLMAPPTLAWLEWRMECEGKEYQMGITLDAYKMTRTELLNEAASLLWKSLSQSLAHASAARKSSP